VDDSRPRRVLRDRLFEDGLAGSEATGDDRRATRRDREEAVEDALAGEERQLRR
jgi:hypothetical protein